MPRQKRKNDDAFPCLVVARAVFGGSMFYQDEDYLSYLGLLRQFVRDRFLTVYAFCLRPHELRLIMKPVRMPISRVMQKLHGAHTLRVNAREKRHGSLFRSRYESKLFSQSEMSGVVRAVHLWPARSGAVRRPEFFRYSSHCAYVGRDDTFADFLEMEWMLKEFSGSGVFSQKSFEKYVESAALDADSDGIESDVDRFLEDKPKPEKNIGFLNDLGKQVSLSFSVNFNNLRGPSRRQDLVMARRLMATIAVLEAQQSVTEVAKFLGRDKAQVSRLVSQGMDLLEADEPFRALYDSVWQEDKRAVDL